MLQEAVRAPFGGLARPPVPREVHGADSGSLDDTWARLSARRFFGDPPAATLRRLVQIVFMPWGDPPSEPESAP